MNGLYPPFERTALQIEFPFPLIEKILLPSDYNANDNIDTPRSAHEALVS